MKSVDIDLGARSYQVRIARGLLARAEEIAPWVRGMQVCIVTDDTVAPLYLAPLRDALAGKQIVECILHGGEKNKTLQGAAKIFDSLMQARCERSVTLIALGGGVVGDMAGFAAACYQRGADFIQVPTTLLAQVDSSVGGKTAVNHALGKNMIGAFHQPRRVLADIATLDSLDRRQFSAGLAEVIKYGAIADAEFFAWLESHIEKVMARDAHALEFVIERSCINKAKIVERDELESGARALLNFGHTFGHAIETGVGYGNWLHGEAVATGMVMAASLSARTGHLAESDYARLQKLLAAAGLPVAPFAGIGAEEMFDHMRADKKVRDGKLRLVLLRAIGDAEVTAEYPADALHATLQKFTARAARSFPAE